MNYTASAAYFFTVAAATLAYGVWAYRRWER